MKDRDALLVLGKALFWDQQLGSDGTACASCHFHAGVDNRSKNQLNPGLKNESAVFPVGDSTFGNSPFPSVPTPSHFRPNYQLRAEDFPLHKLSDPGNALSPVLSDTNDVVSSQGVFNAQQDLAALPFDVGYPIPFLFQADGVMVRNVEPRNTPTTINAIFNHRNFWDGRARAIYNGVNPFGELDPAATVVMFDAAASSSATFVAVELGTGSLASQAVGPPLSDFEMAYHGSTYPEVGRKLLDVATVVLAQQRVAPDDSVLGVYSLRGEGATPGTSLRYRALVEQAFWPKWWDASGWRVRIVNGTPSLIQSDSVDASTFTVMEYNFPLFFGLAIAEYERTLVSDDTPFDRFMAGDDLALTPAQLAGLDLFVDPIRGKCANCHGGPELTTASVRGIGENPVARMLMGDGAVGTYDEGFYNIGVRPSAEDFSLGGAVNGEDLSISQRMSACISARVADGQNVEQANLTCGAPRILAVPEDAAVLLRQAASFAGNPPEPLALIAEAEALLAAPFPVDLVAASAPLFEARELLMQYFLLPGVEVALNGVPFLLPDPLTPILPDPPQPVSNPPPPGTRFAPYAPILNLIAPNERTVANGAFKTPSLRNVELTAPYFHNGGQATLEQVVDFYNRGGDFGHLNPQDLDADIGPMGLTAVDKANLVEFMRALTDERVRWDRAPFDHPSLDIPNGGTPNKLNYSYFAGIGVLDDRVELPETGAGGSVVPLGTANTAFANFPEPLTAPPPATGVTLNTNVPSPQAPGAAVTFTAAGQGSSGYEYRFWLRTGDTWAIAQDYSATNTWTLPTTTPAGDYVVSVWVRTSAASDREAETLAFFTLGAAPPATGVTLNTNVPSPQAPGTAVTFTAQGQGSSGYEYRFWLKTGTTWAIVQDYSATNTWTLPTTTVAGDYVVSVWVRTSAASDREAETLAFFTLGAAAPPATGVTLNTNVASPQAPGTAVTFTAQGQGTSGYEYRFWLKTGTTWAIVQDYSATNTWTLPATTLAGNYVVSVWVRTSTTSSRDAETLVPFTVAPLVPPATGVTVTTNVPSPQTAGTAVTFTAQGQGTSGYQYRFWLKTGTTWAVVQDYSATNTWTLPITTPAGSYIVSVWVRTSPASERDAELLVPFLLH